MTQLVLTNGKYYTIKINPYYILRFHFIEEDEENDKHIHKEKFDKSLVDNNYEEFINFIKYLYICYYSTPYQLDTGQKYDHVKKDRTYIINANALDHPLLDKNKLSKFMLILDDPGYDDRGFNNDEIFFGFDKLDLIYVDQDKTKYDIEIKFSEQDINDIVNGIKQSHTIDYKKVVKLNKFDPEIFIQTSHQTAGAPIILEETEKKSCCGKNKDVKITNKF